MDMFKTGLGVLLILFSLFLRFTVFTQNFLQGVIGLNANEAGNLIQKVQGADLVVFFIIIAVGLFLIALGFNE